MNSKVGERISEIRQLTGQFDVRMKLARTSELARNGRLLEAETFLCTKGKLPQSPAELDLLARIHVRQARYEDARRRWRDAAKLDGSHIYDECIEVLDRWLDYRHKMVLWGLKLAGWLLAATGVAFAFFHYGFSPFK